MRLAAFTWLDRRSGENLDYRALADFSFGGERMPLSSITPAEYVCRARWMLHSLSAHRVHAFGTGAAV